MINQIDRDNQVEKRAPYCGLICVMQKRMTKWIIATGIIIVGGAIYYSTYQEQSAKIEAIKTVKERAIVLDAELQKHCAEPSTDKECRKNLRELYRLLFIAPPEVTRLIYAWEEITEFRSCKNDRNCLSEVAWESAIDDPAFNPEYYAANPAELQSYLERQLRKAQETVKEKHDRL